jgi:hypothetical protein
VTAAAALHALSACGGLNATTDAASGGPIDVPAQNDAAKSIDAAGKTSCDPLAPFGPWLSLGSFQDGLFTLPGQPSADELAFYFSGSSINDIAKFDLYVSRRGSKQVAFGAPTLLTAQNSARFDGNPFITQDGQSLWFESDRSGVIQIYVATKASPLAEFGAPALAAGVNESYRTLQPFLTSDAAELWFSSKRPGGLGLEDVWKATKTPSGFLMPEIVAGLSSVKVDYYPRLSDDRLTIYLTSDRSNQLRNLEVLRSHRSTATDGFPTPTPVAELNTTGDDFVSWISPDNCRVYGQSRGIAVTAMR